MNRFTVKENTSSGTGWHIIDTETGREVAWVYDQARGYKFPEVDEERAKLFADAMNGKFQDEIAKLKSELQGWEDTQ